ncbi:hypothetical protein JVU11DRAFT_2428 [Chiua virens]|nr:hypothetical protein JVU11DRAFT_2428 [Chiua virens]
MDKTKSKLASFFDNDDEESSFPQKPLDDQKLSQYAQGNVRKSRREKEKEAAEAKKREEEESAVKAYADFLDAFEGEDVGRKKTGSAFVRGSGDAKTLYQPSAKGATESGSQARALKDEMEEARAFSPMTSAPKPKGKRAMDAFLEEIKREQALREARYSRSAHGRSVTALAAYEGQSGSKDRGDPETSNLFVANLPSNVTEQSLGQFFARHGPVGSVKIMWPRGDGSSGPGSDMTTSRRNRNAGLSGFVSFMKRKDAEIALRELDGFDWGGSVLRVGWSKAVPMAAKALYVTTRQSRSRSPSRGVAAGTDLPDGHEVGHIATAGPLRTKGVVPTVVRGDMTAGVLVDGHAVLPGDMEKTSLVSLTRLYGRLLLRLKDTVKSTQRISRSGNETTRNMHSSRRGGTIDMPSIGAWSSAMMSWKRILMTMHGYNSVYSTDSAEESEQERAKKTILGRLARKRFEGMLRALSGKRGELARCMTFSLEHAEAAREVSDIIISSLLVDGTPVPRKIARLHLICDILHNSAAPVPSAWKFRQEFQSRLGIVFDHFSTIYLSFPGRITAETFKKQITSVVDIWEDWIVFPPEFTSELRVRLEGTAHAELKSDEQDNKDGATAEAQSAYTSRFKAKSFQPAQEPGPRISPEVQEGGDDVDGAPIEEMDVDGVPIDQDVDGVPLDEDVDGAPLDEDVDGVPLDENVDGIPLASGPEADDADADGEPMAEDDYDVDGVPL